MTSIRPRLRKLARIGHFAVLGVEAVVQLGLVWAVVRLMPPRRWRRWIEPGSEHADAPPQLARDLRRVLRLLTPSLPRRTQCLICAMTARAMLARRGYRSTLSLGTDITKPELAAHAWLSAGEIIITGRENMNAFQEVTRF